MLLGGLAIYLLSDSFANAKWLGAHERAVLEADHRLDADSKPASSTDSLLAVFKNPAIWAFGLIYFCIQSGVYAINFWLPSIIKNLGFSDTLVIGWISAIPYLLAAVFMLLVGRSADLHKERRWHLVVPMLMGALGLLIAVNFAANPAISIGTTKCQRRSLCKSAERPTNNMNSAASRYGIALNQPITRLSLKPRFLMIDGSQKLIA